MGRAAMPDGAVSRGEAAAGGSEPVVARRVLVADDSPVMRRLLEGALSGWGYEVLTASDGRQAWRLLSGPAAPPVAIVDWMMPGLSGLELCRRLRARADGPYVYLILLTARSERDDIVEGLAAGADDYIVKPFDAAELEVRLRAGWRIVELDRQLRATYEQLELAARQDPLTGVLNRGAVLDGLEQELARARRHGGGVGVLLIDLDGFKQCNDRWGHLCGDALLSEFVRRVRSVLRQEDLLGRYGGDEFLVVAPGCVARQLLHLGERILAVVRARPFLVPGEGVPVTASVGGAWARAGRRDAARLIREADEALYRAKRSGRDRVEISAAQPCGVRRH